MMGGGSDSNGMAANRSNSGGSVRIVRQLKLGFGSGGVSQIGSVRISVQLGSTFRVKFGSVAGQISALFRLELLFDSVLGFRKETMAAHTLTCSMLSSDMVDQT
ncbi:hypothetical protein Hdeb2414_s0972g00969811 [Helianthus debilis subsp. tardiflorus]